MTNPDCLIMDEPSEGLAPIIIQGVWEAIGKLKEEGLSILLVEQNASLALKLVDYVHVMSKGQVVYSARPEELRANDEIKASYLEFTASVSAMTVTLSRCPCPLDPPLACESPSLRWAAASNICGRSKKSDGKNPSSGPNQGRK